jgi:putative oxidoreductase
MSRSNFGVSGIAIILGFRTRWIAITLVINFIVALCLVHLEKTYKESFEAIQLLAVSFYFLFNGSG